MIDEVVYLQCPRCGTETMFRSRPVIDATGNLSLFSQFMADELNPKACVGNCGLPIEGDTPCIVLCEHFVGIVLSNPTPIMTDVACTVVSTFMQETPNFDVHSDKPIIVVGDAEQLRRVIRNERGDRFCAVRFDQLTRRNWSTEIEVLKVLSDAYLQSEQPEWAYWILSEAVALFKDLYYDPEFNEHLQLTAELAGDTIASGLKERRTAEDDLLLKRDTLEPLRESVPEWMLRTYFCFYERGSTNFARAGAYLWSVYSKLLQLESDGRLNFDEAEKHLTSVPMQAVLPHEPNRLERAALKMIIHMMSAQAEQRIAILPDDFGLARKGNALLFASTWDSLSVGEKSELCDFYSTLTEGRELLSDFGLGPEA